MTAALPIAAGARRLVVVWRVTTRCNLRCGFCAYDRRLAFERRSAGAESALSLGRLLAAEREPSRPVLVSFLGGEPFSWEPLFDAGTLLRRTFGFDLGVTTNGAALSAERVQEHVLAEYSELTISVDGIGEVHERLRGWTGGFRLLRESVRRIARSKRERAAGLLLRANVVLFRETVEDFFPLCEELADWGVEEITFNPLGGADRPEFYAVHGLSPAQAEAFARELPDYRRRAAALGVKLRGNAAYADRMAATARGAPIAIDDCRPGEDFLFVSEDGQISPCSFTSVGYGRALAGEELAPLPVQPARRLPVLFAATRQSRRLPACDDCKSTQIFGKYADAP